MPWVTQRPLYSSMDCQQLSCKNTICTFRCSDAQLGREVWIFYRTSQWASVLVTSSLPFGNFQKVNCAGAKCHWGRRQFTKGVARPDWRAAHNIVVRLFPLQVLDLFPLAQAHRLPYVNEFCIILIRTKCLSPLCGLTEEMEAKAKNYFNVKCCDRNHQFAAD